MKKSGYKTILVLTIFSSLGFLLPKLALPAPYYDIIDLGTLGGEISIARAINNSGQVVGNSYITQGSATSYPFLWENGACRLVAGFRPFIPFERTYGMKSGIDSLK